MGMSKFDGEIFNFGKFLEVPIFVLIFQFGIIFSNFRYLGVTLGKYHPHPEKEEYGRAREIRKKEIEIHKSQMKGSPFKVGLGRKRFD